MINDLVYNGKNLQSFGYMIKADPGMEVAEREIEFSEQSGGEGSELHDSGGYKNVDRTYEINSFPYWNTKKSSFQIAQELKDWLYSNYGDYKILRDTYNPGYFCYAIPKNPNPLLFVAKKLIDTSITFTRKPFWYSDIGQQKIITTANSSNVSITLNNPETIESLPYFKVELSATATELSISANPSAPWEPFTVENISTVEIDSAEENTFNGAVDLNGQCSCDYYPILTPGINQLVFTAIGANITKVTIIPRWRRL